MLDPMNLSPFPFENPPTYFGLPVSLRMVFPCLLLKWKKENIIYAIKIREKLLKSIIDETIIKNKLN